MVENNLYQKIIFNLRNFIPKDLHAKFHPKDEVCEHEDDHHEVFVEKKASECFNCEARGKLIRGLFRKSIILNKLDVTFEVAVCFMNDLMTLPYLPIIDLFIEEF